MTSGKISSYELAQLVLMKRKKKAQQKLANENNKQREIIEFRRIMGQFYT